MGFLSALFGKKKDAVENDSKLSSQKENVRVEAVPTLHLKGKTDANGLYPSELVMLSVAEQYKTTETYYSSYFFQKYEITNPLKMLKGLQSRGFIEIGGPIDVLADYKVAELKEIATNIGLVVKGKKADIISALSNVPLETLAGVIKERKWKLTAKGEAALKQNPYVQYFLDRHDYDVTSVGVTIWTISEEFLKNTKRLYRDIIYRQLNDRMNEACIAFQTNPMSGSTNTYQYCECYRLMGLFIEEEGKSYINAADAYFQYIYKRINIHEGMKLLFEYSMFSDNKQRRNDIIEEFYDRVQLIPQQRTELLRLIDKLDMDSDALRDLMLTSFRRADDKGIMSEAETADFIIYELSGEVDKSRDLAEKLAKKAVKRIK